jgi:cytidylate kinase
MQRPRSREALVEEQFVRRHIEEIRAARRDAVKEARQAAVLALSREIGAGGGVVARLVGESLGFRVWDREIVHAIAEKSGLREELLASVDERALGARELVQSLSGRGGELYEYAKRLTQILRAIASHGSAVLVGRGATFVVAPDNALRVRVVAPLARRIASFAARTGLAEAEAAVELERQERERRAFSRYYFGADVGDPHGYDLCVNTGALGVEGARDVILAAWRARFGR